MIILGTRHRTVTGGTVEGIQCPICKSDRSQAFGYQHYFHLYWIPTFPFGRTVGMECSHCKRTLLDDEFSDIGRRLLPADTSSRVCQAHNQKDPLD